MYAWIVANALHIAVAASVSAATFATLTVLQFRHCLRSHSLEIGALRERVGVTDDDVNDYHARVHPDCFHEEG
jgi:hypothetical protein